MKIFISLGFKLIQEVSEAVLLEYGIYSINIALDKIKQENYMNENIAKGELVMNCNPFTNGHRYLIETAAKICSELLAFVVEEDKLLFSFEVRYNLALLWRK